MRLTVFLALLLVLGCQQNQRTKTNTTISQTDANVYKTQVLIPQKVIDYLNSNLPGWIIPDTSDYSKTWWSFYDKDQIPYGITADLNGDNLDDYGLILKNSNNIRLVVLLASGDSFTHWIADDLKVPFNGNDIQFGLQIEPPGEFNLFVDGKERTLFLKSKGIALMNFEVKQKIYYWSDKGIKVFKTR